MNLGDIKTGVMRPNYSGDAELTLRDVLTDWIGLRNFQGPIYTDRHVNMILGDMEKSYAEMSESNKVASGNSD